jgi:hypothetical protein
MKRSLTSIIEIVGICSLGLANPQQGNIKTEARNLKAKEIGHVAKSKKSYRTL